jgi:hypothetical protein
MEENKRIDQEREEIFFKKRRRYENEPSNSEKKASKPLILKGQNSRYPNPEDMYNQYREM